MKISEFGQSYGGFDFGFEVILATFQVCTIESNERSCMEEARHSAVRLIG
jgi:hypothetical protein